MDWYRGGSPWNKGAFSARTNGAWAVTVVRDGHYTVECRHYPREADKPLEADQAKLVIGDVVVETTVQPEATNARFELDLKAGDYDLETFMFSGKQKPRGALFVYVSGD